MEEAQLSLYEEIEVSPSASREVIEAACLRLAEKYRPERNVGDTNAKERFRRIETAFRVLTNEERRAEYDRQLATKAAVQRVGTGGEQMDSIDASTKTESDAKNVWVAAIGGGIAGFLLGALVLLSTPLVAAIFGLMMLGWLVGPMLIVVALGTMISGPILGIRMNRRAFKGPCPYCGAIIRGFNGHGVQSVTCKVCRKGATHRDGRLYRIT